MVPASSNLTRARRDAWPDTSTVFPDMTLGAQACPGQTRLLQGLEAIRHFGNGVFSNNWGSPKKWLVDVGLFQGNSQSKMDDDRGYPHFIMENTKFSLNPKSPILLEKSAGSRTQGAMLSLQNLRPQLIGPQKSIIFDGSIFINICI